VSEAEVLEGLQQVFNGVFGRDDIALTPRLSAADVPGWDSFRHVDFIIATEERFGVNLRDADLDAIENMGDLARFVLARVGAPPPR
jgi:acyl carrier protein